MVLSIKLAFNEAPAGSALDDPHAWPAVYSTLIAICFLVFSAFRLWKLRWASVKIKQGSINHIKVVTSLAFLALQLSDLIRSSIKSSSFFDVQLFSNALSSVAAITVCILSFVEHRRSASPSTLLLLYILACLLGHGVELLVLPPMVNKEKFSVLIVHVFLELAVIAVEGGNKEDILLPHYQQLTPEERAGIFGRTFFWWINPILLKGYRSNLTDADLPGTGDKLSSKFLRRTVLRTWDRRAKPERIITLPYVLLACFKWPFLAAILPRLFLIAFRYSQPILINLAIRYVSNAHNESKYTEQGRWLIVGAIIVYIGLATSTAIYQHQLNQLKLMIRGALVGLIHNRSLHVRSRGYEDGNAVTLMSTDVDGLQDVGEMFHETWAQLLEVTIGTSILATQMGWLSLIPLVIIFFCSRVSRYVAMHLKGKQKDWNAATQDRMSMTISMLASAKSIKMLGISEAIKTKVQDLRLHEIYMSKKLRWIMVYYNASANALGIFAPTITLVLFAILSRNRGDGKLDADTAFTTIAVLAMVTHPANMIMTIIPRAVASLANFERIQHYLLESSQQDRRLDIKNTGMESLNPEARDSTPDYVLIASKISVQYPSSSQPILQDIDFKVEAGSFWICSGQVGSGKTTLEQVILGELPPSSGSIWVSTRHIGFCAPVPWLPSTSIKEIICAGSDLDTTWYQTVIYACGLRQDLDEFPDGDETQIGSRGLKLSGGQRQRVALARAVYARCNILVLDDPFSALDGATEHHVVQHLLGPTGLLRRHGITVFLATNNVQWYPLADQIIILGGSKIQLRGTADDVLHSSSQVLKSILNEKSTAGQRRDATEVQPFAQTPSTDAAALNSTRRTGDLAVYGYYFKSVGALNLITMASCGATCSFFLTFSRYWVKWWTEASSDKMRFYAGGYLIFSFVAWFSTSCNMWSTQIKIAPHSGEVLHYKLLKSILGAPLWFYSESEIGTLLNRFSQDIQLVDKQLPASLSHLTNQIFKLLVQAALLISVQKPMLVTLPFCALVVYVVQKIYLRTSRQLRHLELESRSAVYSSFLETVEGITTIRAFGWEKKSEAKNIAQLDKSQSPFYLLLCLQRWLNIVLDLLIAGIAVSVISVAIASRGTTTGGQVGVALNMILLANQTLRSLVESWTDLEISLGAISRLKESIEETPQEDGPGEDQHTLQGWPSAGKVHVDKLQVSYNSDKLALSGIRIEAEAGQRLIICGRTGSGKSTLILALLRLLDPSSGTIRVDGIDISHTSRSAVRQTCFIAVPQDPFLLADASLRFNVDPMEHYEDEEIMAALEKARLSQHFFSNTAKDILEPLDLPLISLPQLSTGQQQLLSLARAVLRAQPPNASTTYTDHVPSKIKPILLLDEATSSLDENTEAMIYEIIQQEFTDKGYTVIAISHRLGALVKGWKKGRDVLVRMAAGRIDSVGDLVDGVGGEGELADEEDE